MCVCVCMLFQALLSLPPGIVGVSNICLLAVRSRVTAVSDVSLADCPCPMDKADTWSQKAVAFFLLTLSTVNLQTPQRPYVRNVLNLHRPWSHHVQFGKASHRHTCQLVYGIKIATRELASVISNIITCPHVCICKQSKDLR